MMNRMAKYINTDLLEVVGFTDREGSFSDGVQWLLEYIDKLPSADVAEVVRCKDCRSWACTDDHHTRGYCVIWHRGRGSKDYCSEGRRKDRSDLKEVEETTEEFYKKAVDAMNNYSKSEMPYNVVTFDVAPVSKGGVSDGQI